MTDTPTPVYGLRTQSLGSNVNTWGDDKLNNVIVALAQLIGQIKEISISGDYTITSTNYAPTADNKNAGWEFTGTLSAAATVTVPSSSAVMYVINGTAGGYAITVKTSAGTGISVPNGYNALLWSDGVNVYNLAPMLFSGGIKVSGRISGVSTAISTDEAPNLAQVIALINAASSGTSGAFITPSVYTVTGGETSISGPDDGGVTLSYTVGVSFLTVYLNGALLIQGSDYTATTGTSITGFPALAANDVMQINVGAPFAVANTYTQAQVDTLISSASVYQFVSSASITATTNLDITGLAPGYDYIVTLNSWRPSTGPNQNLEVRFSQSGTFLTGASDYNDGSNASSISASSNVGTSNSASAEFLIQNPGATNSQKRIIGVTSGMSSTNNEASSVLGGVMIANNGAIDGVRFFNSSGDFASLGTITVFRRRLS